MHRHRDTAHVAVTSALLVVAVASGFARAEEHTRSVKASAYNSTVAQTDENPNEGAWGDTITPGMQVIAGEFNRSMQHEPRMEVSWCKVFARA